jgi:peptide/nickel transport system ATP-binding protein
VTETSQTVEAAAPTETPVLEGRGLVKYFPVRRGWALRGAHVHAVEDVDIALHRGRVTAVVGESGSGKSTLARLLARRSALTGGELRWDGGAVPSGARAYAGQVQLVLQDPFASLNPVHGVRYTLGRALKLHGSADGKPLDEAVKDLLERVALTPSDQFIEKMPHELSGGQRQRVNIARALAVRPTVLLADEPVSMLDVSIRLGVLNLLADLRDRERLAILYVTHDLASARYLADTITVMYAGRVVESGPAVEVADDPQHPYTQLLLSAVPDPDREQAPRLTGAGAPPSLIHPPQGCRFHPRCPFAMDKCRVETPPALPVGSPGHTSSCWLHENGKNAQATPAADTAGAA